MLSILLAGFLLIGDQNPDHFDSARCTPQYESQDRALRDWCEQLRNDPELEYQNEKLRGLEWIERLQKELQ